LAAGSGPLVLQSECLFTVKNITDEHTRYCFVVGALQHESLRLVADIVESPPPLQPYTRLTKCN
jgi:hypothetical protein